MPSHIKRLKIREVSLCANGANERAEILLYKNAQGEGQMFDLAKLPAEVQTIVKAELDRLTAENVKIANELGEVKKSLDETKAKLETVSVTKTEKSEDIFKGMSPEAVAIFKKQQDDLAVFQKALNAERDLRLDREYMEIAKTLVPSVGLDISKAAKLMRVIDQIDKSLGEDLKTILKSAQAAAEKAVVLEKELGKNTSTVQVTDDPYRKLEQIAKSKLENKDSIYKTFADAFLAAVNENQDLYKAHQDRQASAKK